MMGKLWAPMGFKTKEILRGGVGCSQQNHTKKKKKQLSKLFAGHSTPVCAPHNENRAMVCNFSLLDFNFALG